MLQKKQQTQSTAKLQAEVARLKAELKKKKKYGLVWEDKAEDVVERCKKCGDESEFYACPVVSFAVLLGCGSSATKPIGKKLQKWRKNKL